MPETGNLLSCPFCGSRPEWINEAIPDDHYYIRCSGCLIVMKADRRDKVIGMWNIRQKEPCFNCLRYFIEESKVYLTNIGGRKVYIETREQSDGTCKWVVYMDGWNLGKDNKYYWDKSPFDGFGALTRYETMHEAYEYLCKHNRTVTDTRLYL